MGRAVRREPGGAEEAARLLKLRRLIKEPHAPFDGGARETRNDVVATAEPRAHIGLARVARIVDPDTGDDLRVRIGIDLGLEVRGRAPGLVFVREGERRARGKGAGIWFTRARRRGEP